MTHAVRFGNSLGIVSDLEDFKVVSTMVLPYWIYRKILSTVVGCNWKFDGIMLRWASKVDPQAIEFRFHNKTVTLIYSNEVGGVVFMTAADDDDFHEAVGSAKTLMHLLASMAYRYDCLDEIELDEDAEPEFAVANVGIAVNRV